MISKAQFGFRKDMGTKDVIGALTDSVYQNL